ncbi:MAG: helix-turn-helix domain-containing protein [Bacilli bacterium]
MTNGERLYKYRKRMGLSQEELADKLNVSRQAVSKWERDESLPDTNNLLAMAKLYNVSLDDLLNKDPITDDSVDSEVVDDDKKKTIDDLTDEELNNEIRKTIKKKIIIGLNKIDDSNDEDDDEDEEEEQEDKEFEKTVKSKIRNRIIREIDDDDDDDDDDERRNNRLKNKHRQLHNLSNILRGSLYLMVTVAYLLLGFLCNGWAIYWTLYFVPEIVCSIIDCFIFETSKRFNIAFAVLFSYLFVGMYCGIWHPTWIEFFAIPLYYTIASPIEKAIKNSN